MIFDTFRYAKETGDENVYYIDGESFFRGRMENDCTVDTTHPNDHGNFLMADAIEWADIVLCTGSTVCNGTLVDYMDLGKPTYFFGTSLAGTAELLGLKRLCFPNL